MFDPESGLMFQPPIGCPFNDQETDAFRDWLKNGVMGFDDQALRLYALGRARAFHATNLFMKTFPCPFCGRVGMTKIGLSSWTCSACRAAREKAGPPLENN